MSDVIWTRPIFGDLYTSITCDSIYFSSSVSAGKRMQVLGQGGRGGGGVGRH